ncbi:MAG: class I SAM-dependent methyltransferase [Deltaproteobacteria bacterium]|nr:class I SAM-dependent methyltransferase [Deltaproteobacteria bacterium]
MMHKTRNAGWVLVIFLVLTAFVSADAEQKSAVARNYQFSIDWTTTHSAQWLTNLKQFAGKPDVHGLEIGCFEGRTSIWFLEHVATHPSARITCIDVFTGPIEKRFDHNIRVAGVSEKVTKLKGYSQDLLRTLEYESFDFVYIDGCHRASCVLTDSVLVWDLVKPEGVIIFDDYLLNAGKPKTERPKVAIDAFIAVYQDRIEVKEKGLQVIVDKKSVRSEKGLVGSPVVHTPEWEKQYERKKKKQGQQ